MEEVWRRNKTKILGRQPKREQDRPGQSLSRGPQVDSPGANPVDWVGLKGDQEAGPQGRADLGSGDAEAEETGETLDEGGLEAGGEDGDPPETGQIAGEPVASGTAAAAR